jgi:sortase A
MTSGRIHVRKALPWLERALWIAGCCALGYCGFTAVDASLTQARLARSLEQSRIRIDAATRAAVNVPTEPADKAPSPPATIVVARLEIPRVRLSAIILEGVGSQTLRLGLGHVPGTPWPGQSGNTVLAGHRDTFFRPLRKIGTCDEVSLSTPARTYRYRVTSFEVVDPHDVKELTYHGKDELTLITCYPFSYFGPAPKRFIVHAEPVLGPERCRSSWVSPASLGLTGYVAGAKPLDAKNQHE